MKFDLENIDMAMRSPDGTNYFVSTEEGANGFLQSVSSDDFYFFSAGAMKMESAAPEENERTIEHFAFLLATNASKELFEEKVPIRELNFWLKYTMEQIQNLATKPSWIPEEELEEHDKWVLKQCIAMFSHEFAAALAFNSPYFGVLAEFMKARKEEGNLPSQCVCECFLTIVWQAFNTITSSPRVSRDNGPPSHLVVHKLAASGALGEFFRCLLIPELDTRLSEKIESMLKQLEHCPAVLKPHFGPVSPYHHVLREVLDTNAEIRKTREKIFESLKTIVLSLMDNMGAKVSNFLESHWKLMAAKMMVECHTTGLEMKDITVQLDYMPNEKGIIPALQDPPIFKVAPVKDYIEGSPPKEPNFYDKSGKRMNVSIDALMDVHSHVGPKDVMFVVRWENEIRCFTMTGCGGMPLAELNRAIPSDD